MSTVIATHRGVSPSQELAAMNAQRLRIGEDIRTYVPTGAPVRQATVRDVRIAYYQSPAGEIAVATNVTYGTTTVDMPELGGTTRLWGDRAHRIEWEQRKTSDGHFRNALDPDHDGLVDYIARGWRRNDEVVVQRPSTEEARRLQTDLVTRV